MTKERERERLLESDGSGVCLLALAWGNPKAVGGRIAAAVSMFMIFPSTDSPRLLL